MANFFQASKKAKEIKPSRVKKDFFKYIRAIEKEFFALNIDQIEEGENADGKILENSDGRFKGIYSKATEAWAELENPKAPKKEGELYNFLWSGEFIKGFEMYVKNGDLDFFSTGTGTGDKAKFFKGYEDLFGLSDNNLKEVISKFLLPFLLQFFKERLT